MVNVSWWEIFLRLVVLVGFGLVEIYKHFNNRVEKLSAYKVYRNLFALKQFTNFYLILWRITFLLLVVQLLTPETIGALPLVDRVGLPRQIVGLGLFFSAVFSYFWARFTLGEFWTPPVCIKKNHRLIVEGPYRHERHPVYVSFVLMVFSSQLIFGSIFMLMALIFWVGYRSLAKVEENFLAKEFGKQWSDYRKKTKTLLLIS